MNDHEQLEIKFEYSQITDYIYIGTNMCCVSHFEDVLIEQGIKADISLEKERMDNPTGVDYFLWLPTEDHTPPTQEQLEVGVNALQSFVSLKQKVYVHCKNGHGRAPTLVAAYLIREGKSLEDAIELIRSKREKIHLEDSQIEALKNFKK